MTEDDDQGNFKLEGYTGGLGKGITTYFNDNKFSPSNQINSEKFQIMKFRHEVLDLIGIYRSQTGNSLELLQELRKIIDPGRVTIVGGDFNACFLENSSNRLIDGLLVMGFDQLVHEATHIKGRLIDHVYFNDPTDKLKITIERYSPYYTDHDGICVTLQGLA